MKQKLLTLMTLLLCAVSGAWADYYTPTADEVILLKDAYNADASGTGYSNHAAVAWGGKQSGSDKTAGDPNNNGAATSSNVKTWPVKGGNTTNKQITVSISGCSKLTVYHESRSDRMFLADITPSAGAASTASSLKSTYYTEIELDGTKSYTLVFHGYGLNDTSSNQDFYLYAFKLTKYVAKEISTQALAGVKVGGTALTEDAAENGYSVSGTTITLSDDLVAYATPTNVTLTNHITYTDSSSEDKNVAVSFDGTVTAGYFIGTATIGATDYTVRMKKGTQTVTGVSVNGSAISASDLTTLQSTGAVSIDGSALNGIGMIDVTLSGGTTTITRTNTGDNAVFTFSLNGGADDYTVKVTDVKKTYTAQGAIVYYAKDGESATGAGTKSLTANGINFTYPSKKFDYGTGQVTIGENVYQPIKLSTGESVTVTFPDGKKATKVIVYGWSVNGNGKMYSIKETAEGSKTAGDLSSDIFYANNTSTDIYPSVYEYDLDNWESMVFSCGGSASQPFIVMDFVLVETKVATPAITPADGSLFDGSQKVTITCETADATIHYTTDGTTPTASSATYSSPFNVTNTTTVKAIAVKAGLQDSNVATAKLIKVNTAFDRSWDFGNWSAATKTGTIADATNWNQYEKADSKGLNFGDNGRSNVGSLSKNTLKYGSTNIEETNGLKFTSSAYGLGLIYNLPSATISEKDYTYHGSQYLWLYSNSSKIVIPDVLPGSTIGIGVESHNGGDARGVTLTGGDATQIAGSATSMTYQDVTWRIPTGGEVTITPNKGLHIYYITIFKNSEIEPVSSFGWSTYITKTAASFAANTAYVVTEVDGSNIVTEAVTSVPANTPILLKGEGNKTITPLLSADAPATNLLSVSNGTANGTKIPYVLAKNGESAGFKKWTGDIAKLNGRVVLWLDSEIAARDFFDLDGEATGINKVVNNQVMDNQYYNLAGQRVAQPTKGLYIVNGKKVIIK